MAYYNNSFIFIFNKLLKQGAVKEEKTFRKFDCNK